MQALLWKAVHMINVWQQIYVSIQSQNGYNAVRTISITEHCITASNFLQQPGETKLHQDLCVCHNWIKNSPVPPSLPLPAPSHAVQWKFPTSASNTIDQDKRTASTEISSGHEWSNHRHPGLIVYKRFKN